jgi:hypothetical protein
MTSTGDTRSVAAVVLDRSERLVSPPPAVSWSTNAPAVATVTSTGSVATITAVGDGTAIITASSGTLTQTTTVKVHRLLASVVVAPVAPIGMGFDGQVSATARDARGNEITGLASLTYSSDNPSTVIVSPTGVLNALFQFPQTLTANITATATKDGITVSGSTRVDVSLPPRMDDAAIMLSDFVRPVAVPSRGAGLAYFVRDEGIPVGSRRFFYVVTWSALTSPATSAHIHFGTSYDKLGDVLIDFPLTQNPVNFGTLLGIVNPTDIRPQGGRPPISMDSLTTLLNNGNLYFDVHSATHPGGEIVGHSNRVFQAPSEVLRCAAARCP